MVSPYWQRAPLFWPTRTERPGQAPPIRDATCSGVGRIYMSAAEITRGHNLLTGQIQRWVWFSVEDGSSGIRCIRIVGKRSKPWSTWREGGQVSFERLSAVWRVHAWCRCGCRVRAAPAIRARRARQERMQRALVATCLSSLSLSLSLVCSVSRPADDSQKTGSLSWRTLNGFQHGDKQTLRCGRRSLALTLHRPRTVTFTDGEINRK